MATGEFQFRDGLIDQRRHRDWGGIYTIGVILLGSYRDSVKENGNHYSILGLCRDSGKENGSYYILFRAYG